MSFSNSWTLELHGSPLHHFPIYLTPKEQTRAYFSLEIRHKFLTHKRMRRENSEKSKEPLSVAEYIFNLSHYYYPMSEPVTTALPSCQPVQSPSHRLLVRHTPASDFDLRSTQTPNFEAMEYQFLAACTS